MVFCFLLIAGCESRPARQPDTTNRADARMAEEMQRAVRIEAAGGEVLNVGFLGVETVFNSELMAPYDVIQHTVFRDSMQYMQPFIVSPDGKPFVTFEGIAVDPHYSFENSPDIDVLVIPSSDNSMTLDLENEKLMSWLTQAVEKAQYVITVCDGAFPLAATGALDGPGGDHFSSGSRSSGAYVSPSRCAIRCQLRGR